MTTMFDEKTGLRTYPTDLLGERPEPEQPSQAWAVTKRATGIIWKAALAVTVFIVLVVILPHLL